MDILKALWANKQVRSAAVSLVGALLTAGAAYAGTLSGPTAGVVAGFLFWAAAQASNLIPKDG